MTADRTKKSDPLALLTLVALVLLLGTVAARATVAELSNDIFGLAGSADAGSGPGPSTTILLNLLCCVPAVLVLVRRAIDPTYVLRWHVSQAILFVLAAWISLSAIWASNRFDALLGASTWWTAAAVLWAAGQLCRSWTRLRPVLALAVGLLMIFGAQTLIYRFYEAPELQHYWDTDPDLKARREADPNDFTVHQMELAIHGNAQQGFYRSPNTFAAIGVLAAMITAGFVGQHLLARRRVAAVAVANEPAAPPSSKLSYQRPDLTKQNDPSAWLAIVILAIPLLGVPTLILWTGSRTAGATAVMAAIALAVAWPLRTWLAKHAKLVYALGVVAVLLGVAVVIGVGLATGGLLHDSLNFRWNYWVASAGIVKAHPWLGVGWTNFGSSYLTYRLPVAAEEVKDPHNLFVHFATETGLVGLLLATAWVARMLWEVTRPVEPKAAAPSSQSWINPALGIAALFWVLRTAVLWPLTVTPTEAGKTALFALLLLVAQLMAVVRSPKDPAADERPAPFLVYAAVIGLLAFLLHNNVDFAVFETGPLLVFAVVVGGLLGVRHPGVAGKTPHTLAAIGGLVAVFIGLLVVGGLWAVPVMLAESKAAAAEEQGRAANDAIHNGRPDTARDRATQAANLYREAMANTPVANPDYASRAVRFAPGDNPNEVLALLSLAIAADPADPQNYLQRARYERMSHADANVIQTDYLAFIARNPNDATIRVEYADYLDSIGQRDQAKTQLRAALATNAALHADEPRRLPADKVKAIEERLR